MRLVHDTGVFQAARETEAVLNGSRPRLSRSSPRPPAQQEEGETWPSSRQPPSCGRSTPIAERTLATQLTCPHPLRVPCPLGINQVDALIFPSKGLGAVLFEDGTDGG